MTTENLKKISYYIKKLYPDAINRYTDLFDNGMEDIAYNLLLFWKLRFDAIKDYTLKLRPSGEKITLKVIFLNVPQ